MSERPTQNRTPLFAGSDTAPQKRQEARAKALDLLDAHPELGYSLLFSAASYLLRDGQPLRDSAVLTEARRRQRWMHAAIAKNEKRFGT